MQIPLTKIFLILMFVFTLFSNVLNYVAIGTNFWLTISNIVGNNPATSVTRYLWGALQGPGTAGLSINVYALIATGTALNILALILAFLSLLSLCIAKIRDSFAIYFVFGCLITCLLALLFNSTGWYFVMNDDVQNDLKLYTTGTTSILFCYSFWLMTPSFACDILAALFASCIIGCSFALNKFENKQRRSQGQTSQAYQVSTTKGPSYNNEAFGFENRPAGVQSTTYTYQNETYQNEQRVLRL
jgi:hypothetical protein